MSASQTITAESVVELRAEIGRQQVVIYELAPKVGLHPAHLGQVLRGRRPLSPELAARIRAALSRPIQDGPPSDGTV